MESSTPGIPPKVPPKRAKKPSTGAPLPPFHTTETSDEPLARPIDGLELSTMAVEESPLHHTDLVRSCTDALHSMNDSISELDQLTMTSEDTENSVMSSSLFETGSISQGNCIMTTSLPEFPADATSGSRQTNRPTPLPRPSIKSKPAISKRLVNASVSSSQPNSSAPMPAPRQISKVSTNSSSTSKTSLLEQSGPALLVTPSSSAVAASTGNPLIHSTNKEEDDNVYCNVDRAPSITPVQRKDSGVELPSQGSVEIENTYANTEPPCMQDPRFSAVQGIPLPPAVRGSGDTAAVTPLSEEVRQLLDPVEYMSLWELRSQLPPYAASGSASQPTEPPRSMEAPPVLGKKKSGPPIPPRESEKLNTFGQASFPAVSDSLSTDEHEPPIDLRIGMLTSKTLVDSDAFRNSFVLPLPNDPFADLSGHEMFNLASHQQDVSHVDPYTSAEPVYSLADEPNDQRLLAKRSAGSGQVSSSGSDTALYSQVNKSDHQETSSSPYLLAEDLDSNLDNHAVSYDSEDTVDEDSDSDEASPNLPPKQLPVVQTPRSPLTDRHGYLYKQGGKQNNKGWRKRYVTFDGTRLRYFSGAKSRISKRIIPVEVMKDIESDVKDSHTGKFKFRVVTINRNRNYLFAAETLEDHDYWTQILMKAIIEYKQETGRGSIGQGMMLGGSIMHTPEKQGYVRLDDNKIYMAIKEGRMCYYKNEVDFNFATAIHEVKLCIASVKDLGKNRLQFATPYHTYSITFESDGESEEWKLAIEEGIATSLSDDKVLTQVYQNPSNRLCADCSCPRPQWAVLHLVTMVCSSCAGLHRQFWPFKVKSLRMDVKVWTKPLISLYVNAGNGVMNSVWEGALTNPSDKIKCSAILSRRQSYMVEKYLLKAFFLPAIDIVPDKPSSLQLRQGLEKSIKEGRLKQVVFLVNKGADPSPGVLAVSSVQLAESANQSDIAQYLKVNGAENETLKDIWAVIRSKHSDKNTENVVIKSGYLYRMGKKDYPRQWIVLKPSFLKCYDEETSEEPKHTIPLCSIVNLSRHENEKNEPSLEFTCQDGNTCTYIFGADERSTIDAWITKIHSEMLIDTEKQDLCLEFAKAGHANCKRGHLGVWKLCWLLVRKRQMYMHYTDGTSKEEVDLRKIHNLTIETPKEASANPASEKGPVISLFSSDRSLSGSDQRDIIYYIQSDLKQETERWFKVIDDASKEVSSSLEDQQLNRDNVPILIEKCVDFVSIHGMKTEGIYRLAGTHSKITNLLNDLIKGARGVDIKMEEYTVLDAADTLKRYLRHLQDPIMSSALYGKWLSASMISLPSIDSHRFQEVHEEKLYTYKNLLSELPDVNFASLKMIIGHLHRVASYEAENKMGRVNLATVFGPVLLSGSLVEKPTQATFQCTNYEIKLVDDLISYYQWLFSIDDEELKKETQVQRYIQLIKEAEHQPPRAKDFIFSIYVNNKMCDPISMEVPAVMTAEQVVEKVAQSKRIPRIDGYSLFHIVCGGDLERSLAASEKVLDVNLVTWNWSDEHRKDSYLCVKEDQYRDYMDQVSGQDIGRFTELQFSDRKGWKKMYFELNESLLICYKDKSKTKHYEWDLSLLSIYIGVEKKRKPPTIFGLTFLTQEDSGTKQTHLGRSVCFPTSSEMYIWLSAMYSQSEDKLSSPAPSFSGLSYSESKKNPISKSRVGSILKNPFKGSKS